MNKTILTLTAAFSFCGALSSEDSVEAWIGRSGNPPNLTKTADGLQTLPGKEFYVFSAKPVPLKKDVRYSVSGSFKRAPGNTERNVPLFFAVAFYDKDGKWIHGMEACPVSGTLTELAAPAKKGDRIIKLKDASKWQKRPSNIAFHAKTDESDLPNRDLSPYVTSVEQMDGVWEVTLRTALRKSYEAGTLCRQQSGSPFHYIRLGVNLKDEWSTFSAVIPPSAIWRGAASMKIVCFSNPGKPASICMKSVGIRELPMK